MITLFSEKYNFEYYHVPKNGMTSVLRSTDIKWVDQETAPKDRKVVCVLRDPVDRIISSYFFLKMHPKIQSIRTVTNEMVQKMFRNDDITGFKEYLNEIRTNGPFDNHNLPQLDYLNDKNGIIPGDVKTNRSVDKITDFIEFKDMSNGFSEIVGEPINIKHLNKSSSTKEMKNKIKNLYSEQIIELYKEDYELYKINCL